MRVPSHILLDSRCPPKTVLQNLVDLHDDQYLPIFFGASVYLTDPVAQAQGESDLLEDIYESPLGSSMELSLQILP